MIKSIRIDIVCFTSSRDGGTATPCASVRSPRDTVARGIEWRRTNKNQQNLQIFCMLTDYYYYINYYAIYIYIYIYICFFFFKQLEITRSIVLRLGFVNSQTAAGLHKLAFTASPAQRWFYLHAGWLDESMQFLAVIAISTTWYSWCGASQGQTRGRVPSESHCCKRLRQKCAVKNRMRHAAGKWKQGEQDMPLDPSPWTLWPQWMFTLASDWLHFFHVDNLGWTWLNYTFANP